MQAKPLISIGYAKSPQYHRPACPSNPSICDGLEFVILSSQKSCVLEHRYVLAQGLTQCITS